MGLFVPGQMKLTFLAVFSVLLLQNVICKDEAEGYFGKSLGALSEHHHAVKGHVYAVDSRTIHIRHFTYDGEGPGAYFYAGNSKSPSGAGFRLRDEKGSPKVLRKYNDEHITLSLPEGKTLNSIKWFSVWCEDFSVNFGDVKIPKSFDYPKPKKLEGLSGIHGVSSDPVVIVDSQTFLVPNFSYDGEAPDAKFWVGSGDKPTSQGIKVADENGRFEPLKKYDRKTLVITLPLTLTVHEIGHFGIWCEAFAVDFAHVAVPASASVPPSLRMLGVSPQSKLNCEILHDASEFEVRWALAGDSAVVQLVGKIDPGEYMSFGLSGDDTKTKMLGGDAVVAWVDPEDFQGHAQDYFFEGKSQCAGTRGSCPDNRIREGTDNIRLLNSALVNGYSIITYQRPIKGTDELDRAIYNNGTEQAIIWAVGPLNSKKEVSFHSAYPKGNIKFDFSRSPEWNCPLPANTSTPSSAATNLEKEMSSSISTATPKPVKPPKDAWDIPPIPCHEPDDGVFYAQMGPTGGKRGYSAITGHVGWGISWFINGLLIPEINVVRGKSYTFVVEGGDNPEIPARYHPFYITDDPIGGYEHKTAEERKAVKVFAGVKFDKRGKHTPTATGRLCNWTPSPDHAADDSPSFGAYQQTLKLECDEGEPGIMRWTPDNDTPDTVYYQCFTHRYLGWKINVVDSCDSAGQQSDDSSESSEELIDRNGDSDEPSEAASIIFETRVKVPVGDKSETIFLADAAPSPSGPADLFPPSAAQVSYINSLTSRKGEEDYSKSDESKEHPQFESPKVTETFEPMFVPSPVDRNIKETPRVNAFRPAPNKGKHFLRRPPPRLRAPTPAHKRAAPYYRRTHHHQY